MYVYRHSKSSFFWKLSKFIGLIVRTWKFRPRENSCFDIINIRHPITALATGWGFFYPLSLFFVLLTSRTLNVVFLQARCHVAWPLTTSHQRNYRATWPLNIVSAFVYCIKGVTAFRILFNFRDHRSAACGKILQGFVSPKSRSSLSCFWYEYWSLCSSVRAVFELWPGFLFCFIGFSLSWRLCDVKIFDFLRRSLHDDP